MVALVIKIAKLKLSDFLIKFKALNLVLYNASCCDMIWSVHESILQGSEEIKWELPNWKGRTKQVNLNQTSPNEVNSEKIFWLEKL